MLYDYRIELCSRDCGSNASPEIQAHQGAQEYFLEALAQRPFISVRQLTTYLSSIPDHYKYEHADAPFQNSFSLIRGALTMARCYIKPFGVSIVKASKTAAEH